MHKFKGKFSYSVEVPLTNFNTQGQNKFNDLASNSLLNPSSDPNLVVAITGIETFYSSLYAFSVSNRPIVTQADAASLAITFNVANQEPLYQIPYLSLGTVLNYGEIREIEPTPINLQKSYVIVQNTITSGAYSAVINFWYDKFTQAEWHEVRSHLIRQKMGMSIEQYAAFRKQHPHTHELK